MKGKERKGKRRKMMSDSQIKMKIERNNGVLKLALVKLYLGLFCN